MTRTPGRKPEFKPAVFSDDRGEGSTRVTRWGKLCKSGDRRGNHSSSVFINRACSVTSYQVSIEIKLGLILAVRPGMRIRGERVSQRKNGAAWLRPNSARQFARFALDFHHSMVTDPPTPPARGRTMERSPNIPPIIALPRDTVRTPLTTCLSSKSNVSGLCLPGGVGCTPQ